MTTRSRQPWDDDRLSAYVDDRLASDERRQFEEELQARPELRAALDELQRIRTRLQSLPRHQLPGNFADRVLKTAEQRMLRGTDARLSPEPARRDNSHTRRWLYVALATTAAVVSLAILRPRDPDRTVAGGPQQSANPNRKVARTEQKDRAVGRPDAESIAAAEHAQSQPVPSAVTTPEGAEPPYSSAGDQLSRDSSSPSNVSPGNLSRNERSATPSGTAPPLGKASPHVDPSDSPSIDEVSPALIEQAVVASPRNSAQIAHLQQFLPPIDASSEDSAVWGPQLVERPSDLIADRTPLRENQSFAAEARERAPHDAVETSPVYDLFLVSAHSLESLERFVEQLQSEQMEVKAVQVPPLQQGPLSQTLQGISPPLLTGAAGAGRQQQLQYRHGRRVPMRTDAGEDSVEVTALGRVQGDARSLDEVVEQLAFAGPSVIQRPEEEAAESPAVQRPLADRDGRQGDQHILLLIVDTRPQ